MYTLFYSPGSASMVIHQALLEIGAPHELKRVDFEAGAQRDPAYLKMNPQGVVPTLVIDGRPPKVAVVDVVADVPGRGRSRHQASYCGWCRLTNLTRLKAMGPLPMPVCGMYSPFGL